MGVERTLAHIRNIYVSKITASYHLFQDFMSEILPNFDMVALSLNVMLTVHHSVPVL
jgi:hypothetical protein